MRHSWPTRVAEPEGLGSTGCSLNAPMLVPLRFLVFERRCERDQILLAQAYIRGHGELPPLGEFHGDATSGCLGFGPREPEVGRVSAATAAHTRSRSIHDVRRAQT